LVEGIEVFSAVPIASIESSRDTAHTASRMRSLPRTLGSGESLITLLAGLAFLAMLFVIIDIITSPMDKPKAISIFRSGGFPNYNPNLLFFEFIRNHKIQQFA
jgi:hypothetical protein